MRYREYRFLYKLLIKNEGCFFVVAGVFVNLRISERSRRGLAQPYRVHTNYIVSQEVFVMPKYGSNYKISLIQ